MEDALSLGQVLELHNYARQLLEQKKTKEAFNVFRMNYEKHPEEFTTMVGMARGHSALGEYKKALAFARKAIAKAPDKQNKDTLEGMIKKLQEAKDMNL